MKNFWRIAVRLLVKAAILAAEHPDPVEPAHDGSLAVDRRRLGLRHVRCGKQGVMDVLGWTIDYGDY